MIITRAYKVRLKPNADVERNLEMHLDAARFIYNWALSRRKEEYQSSGKSLTAFTLNKELTVLKQTYCPWLYEVSNTALQSAIQDVCRAYENFFRRVKQGGCKPGFPRFKSKKNPKASFRLYGSIHVFDSAIQLPVIGRVRLKETGYLPTGGVKILNATVSRCIGRWFVSLQVEQEVEPGDPIGEPVGVDVGIKHLAVVSDGTVIENPKALYRMERKLKRKHRELCRRKKKGGANRQKSKEALAKIYARIANIRNHHLHQASHYVTDILKPTAVGVESLNVQGMAKNARLAKAVSDSAMSELLRQIAYKSLWNKSEVVRADRFYPSSKTCSGCGNVKEELRLDERVYRCEFCGLVIDRDLNAARNLALLAGKSPESLNACGWEGADAQNIARETVPDEAGTRATEGVNTSASQ